MTVVCRSFSAPSALPTNSRRHHKKMEKDGSEEEEVEHGDGEGFDILSSIHSHNSTSKTTTTTTKPLPPPYTHPSTASSFLSQRSLEVCTETLCSETGSDDFSSSDELDFFFSGRFSADESVGESEPDNDDDDDDDDDDDEEEEEEEYYVNGETEKNRGLVAVNYPFSPLRRFPPPLRSISRRDGPCFGLRSLREGGRLVVFAVPVPSQNYLHAERHGGRLLLSFVTAATMTFEGSACSGEAAETSPEAIIGSKEEQEEELVVTESAEKKQSKQSGIVVVGAAVTKLPASSTEKAASGAIAAGGHACLFQLNNHSHGGGGGRSNGGGDSEATKESCRSEVVVCRSKEEMMQSMRRSSQLRRPLFIWEMINAMNRSWNRAIMAGALTGY